MHVRSMHGEIREGGREGGREEARMDDDDDDDDDDASAHVRFRFDILLTRMLDDSLPAAGFDWCRTETALRWHRNGIQFLNGCD